MATVALTLALSLVWTQSQTHRNLLSPPPFPLTASAPLPPQPIPFPPPYCQVQLDSGLSWGLSQVWIMWKVLPLASQLAVLTLLYLQARAELPRALVWDAVA